MKPVTLFLAVVMLVGYYTCADALEKKPDTPFALTYPGHKGIVDYKQYGSFENAGTNEYIFKIKNLEELAQAVGSGIYPNTKSLFQEPLYKELKAQEKLSGLHWNHVYSGNPVIDFFVWAQSEAVDPGVKLFFTAHALKEAGLVMQAIKAYYALLVHFPRSACFTADGAFVWYLAPGAISKLYSLCRRNPELGLKLEGASFYIQNGDDTNLENDIIKVNPGQLVSTTYPKPGSIDLSKMKIAARRGNGTVRLVKYDNGHWQMMVDGKPYIIKAVSYAPTKIGESPHYQTMRNWMFVDDNGNGIIDAPYEAWVDKNSNNQQDPSEHTIGDFQLLKDMGCNTIKYYHVSPDNTYSKNEFNKKLLRKLYHKYGIRVIMGDFLGAYTVGSGADWNVGTDYRDPEQCARMKEIVRNLVQDHKDETYVLMWLLGNENNLQASYQGINATRTLAATYPQAYAEFLQEVAQMIHELDPNHPVAVGNEETGLIEYYNTHAPAIDILGINYYADKDGFGSLWSCAKDLMDRPVIITEYGCDSFDSRKDRLDETGQAAWHQGCWEDIVFNLAAGPGDGNALGGVVFEWLDEWWKSNKGSPSTQQQTKDCSMAFPDGFSSEEFLGIMGQGDGSQSPFLRQPRKAYFVYKEMWREK